MKQRSLAVTAALGAATAVLLVQPAAAQKDKGQLRVATQSPIVGVSYYLDPKPESTFLARAVYDGLVTFDRKAKKLAPLLAKSWKRINPTTVEFQLRDDVKWHDGEKFDADDVVYTFAWLTDKKTKIRFKRNWAHIKEFQKVGPHTVRMITKKPTPFDMMRLAYRSEIVPQHLHSKAANKLDYVRKAVGTGMYKTVLVDKNKGIFLERNKDFKHGGSKRGTNIDKLSMLFIPDQGAQIAAYSVGGLEAIRSIDLDVAESLVNRYKDSELQVAQGLSWRYIALDAKGRSGNSPLTDVRVRKALMMAVDTRELDKIVTGRHPVSRVPSQMCWRIQVGCDFSKKAPAYDLAAAKKLMAEAGHANGFKLEITTFTSASIRGSAEIISAQLKKIGVTATVKPLVIGAYRKKQRQGKIQMMVGGYPGGGMPDVAGTTSFIYAAPKSRDYHGDEALKKLGRQVLSQMDPGKRKAVAREMFDRAAEMAYFKVLGPGPTVWVRRKSVSIDGGAITSFGVFPSGLRFN